MLRRLEQVAVEEQRGILPELACRLDAREGTVEHRARSHRAKAQHAQRDQHDQRAFVRVIACGAVITMRMIVVSVTMRIVNRVANMLALIPARFAEEGQEYQTP